MFCPYCGTDVADGSAICPACNADLAHAASQPTMERTAVMPEQAAAGQQAYSAQAQQQPYSQLPYAQQGQAAYAQPAYGQRGAASGMPPYGTGPSAPARPPQGGKSNRARNVIIAIAVAVVVALAAVGGLAFAGIINVPFLPRSPELTMLNALHNVVKDGEFDASMEIDLDADMGMKYSGKDYQMSLDLDMAADGTVSGYIDNSSDVAGVRIDNGNFSAKGGVSTDGTGGRESVEAAGTYSLDIAKGVLEYSLKKPYSYSDTIEFDPDELVKAIDEQDVFDFDISSVENMKMEGNTITFTIKPDTSKSEERMNESLKQLENMGVDVDNVEYDMEDIGVTIVIDDTTGAIDITAVTTATMSMEVDGRAFGAGSTTIPISSNMDMTFKTNLAPKK